MNDFQDLLKAVDRLKRNETQMSEEQKRQYAERLKSLREHITSLALKVGRAFLTEGVRLSAPSDGPRVMNMIHSVISESEWTKAEEAALTTLFHSYSVDSFLTALCPIRNKAFYQGYGIYWAEHCSPVTESDGDIHFSYYNDIIDMFWTEKLHEWKRKGKWKVIAMLPPTMEMINEAYAIELKELEANDGKQ